MKKIRLYYEEHNKGPLQLLWQAFCATTFRFFWFDCVIAVGVTGVVHAIADAA